MTPLRLLGRRRMVLELYRRMVLLRAFETAIGCRDSTYDAGGELVTAAAGAALGRDDYVVTAASQHGLALARGFPPDAVIAGLLGDGRARARWQVNPGGLHAVADLAPALLNECPTRCVLSMPGTEQARSAAVRRALAAAVDRRVPTVFVLQSATSPSGVPVERADAYDAGGVYEAAGAALSLARRKRGPAVLELATDHVHEEGIERDPLSVTALRLAELGTEVEQLLAIADDAEHAVTAAVERISADAISGLVEAASPA